MKLLTALAPAVLIFGLMGCNSYGSMNEAERACIEWSKGGKPVRQVQELSNAALLIFSRRCKIERETNQVLGFVNKMIEDGEWRAHYREGEFKIVKRFHF